MKTEKKSKIPKVGRRKKSDTDVLYFGMKVTSQEKEKIKKLALCFKTTSTQAVLKAVDLALLSQDKEINIPNDRRITADELISMDKRTREKILREQAKLVAKYDDVIEDGFDIIDD
ncbi:MAG: hypothetical protein ACK4IX_03455 [Candidatus Sericytochromatia bacterium]